MSFSAPGQTTRLLSSDVAEALTRFDAPMAEGKTILVSLDAVAHGFGKRWALRSEQVYEHAERTLEKLIGAQGCFLRVSETDFLVCQPEIGVFSGQAVCLRALREILGHFLGAAHLADTGIHRVTKLSNGVIEAEQLDARTIETEAEREAPMAPSRPGPEADHSASFVTPAGRALRVSCVLEPVFELKHFNRIGMRVARQVVDLGPNLPLDPVAIRLLPSADIVRADLATLDRGVSRLRADTDGRQPTLILPISYVSLSSPRGRTEIIRAVKEAGSLVQQGVICEICDIEGVPPSAVAAAVALVRPLTLYLLGAVPSGCPRTIAGLKGSGLRGVTLPAESRVGMSDATKVAIDVARKISIASIIHGVASGQQAAEYALLGATHVSLRSVIEHGRDGSSDAVAEIGAPTALHTRQATGASMPGAAHSWNASETQI